MSSDKNIFRGNILNEGLFGYINTVHNSFTIASLLGILSIEEQKALIKRIQYNIEMLKVRKK